MAWEEFRGAGMVDARIYSYRHGKKEPYLPLGSYAMDVGFFDGHVERMNDILSANPHLWMPRGFRLYLDENDVHPDVVETYMQVLETDPRGDQFIYIR
jgi:prepilin-type processing-associated H-X9-DG protein